MPVAATDPARLHAHYRAIGPRRSDRKFDHLERAKECRDLRREHHARRGDDPQPFAVSEEVALI
ncbi:MAG: hypothetical protein ABSF52_17735 [Syntrophobacteraceae bacterium]